MAQKTHLSYQLERSAYATRYDAAVKNLVKDKQDLARIVKGTV